MGTKLEEIKKDNIEKIRLGSCIELLLLLDSFVSDFNRLEEYIRENSFLFINQNENIILKQFSDMQDCLTNDIDILLNDIDKSERYCNYLNRYY